VNGDTHVSRKLYAFFLYQLRVLDVRERERENDLMKENENKMFWLYDRQ